MKPLFLFVFFLTSLLCQSQTKIIAHKSHSGSNKSFIKAYKNNLFDIKRSNFGLPYSRKIIVLDKVVALNDSLTVLFLRESNVCYQFLPKYTDLKKSDFTSKTDTIKNHKIYKKSNTVAFIKSSKVWITLFDNPINDVKFIGFAK